MWRSRTLLILLLVAPLTMAHHGWDQVSDEWLVLRGEVLEFKPSNPHSELALLVENRVWFVELGPPWRNQRAGLRAELLDIGRAVVVQGHRRLDREQWVKAVRIVIDGRNYDLYPDRLRQLPPAQVPEDEVGKDPGSGAGPGREESPALG